MIRTLVIWLLFCSVSFGQIKFNDMPGPTNDQKMSQAIDEAKRLVSVASGRNVYITADPGAYRFKRPINFGRVSWHVPGGRRIVQFLFTNQQPGNVLVTFEGGHGQTANGLWVTAASVYGKPVENLTAFKFAHVSSLHATNLDARLEGANGVGYLITDEASWRNTESCRFQSISAHCSMPMHFVAGDNCQFENIDFTCWPPTTGENIWAGIQGGPRTVLSSIRFSGSIQKGHHAVYFNSQFQSGTRDVGDIGIFDGIRYEQGTVNPSDPAAWVLRFRRRQGTQIKHGQEAILMTGCRSGTRTHSVDVKGVLKFETVGSFIAGRPVD